MVYFSIIYYGFILIFISFYKILLVLTFIYINIYLYLYIVISTDIHIYKYIYLYIFSNHSIFIKNILFGILIIF